MMAAFHLVIAAISFVLLGSIISQRLYAPWWLYAVFVLSAAIDSLAKALKALP